MSIVISGDSPNLTSANLTTPIVTTTMGVGGATPAASGSGITFPATQSASSDANTLDDYEEGTWTPTFTLGSGSLTYSNQTGTYTKIGRQVTATFYVVVNVSSSGVSNSGVAGLPFMPANTTYAGSAFAYYGAGIFNSYAVVQGLTAGGTAEIQLRGTNNSAVAPALVFAGATFTNGTAIAGTVTYFTS